MTLDPSVIVGGYRITIQNNEIVVEEAVFVEPTLWRHSGHGKVESRDYP